MGGTVKNLQLSLIYHYHVFLCVSVGTYVIKGSCSGQFKRWVFQGLVNLFYHPFLGRHSILWAYMSQKLKNIRRQTGQRIVFIYLSIIALLQLSQLSLTALPCPAHPPLPQSIPTLLSMSMGHLSLFLDYTLPFLSLRTPPPLSSGGCQSVLYFHASGSMLLIYLFCSLGSTYRWDLMVFVFHCLVYFT